MRACVEQEDFHLARVSRGSRQKDASYTSNMRSHLYVHHEELFNGLLKAQEKLEGEKYIVGSLIVPVTIH